MSKNRFKVSKWIMLSLAILFNGFIIFYSSLSEDATYKLERPFTNFFVGLVNSFSKKEIKNIPLKSINVSISDDKYNNIPGYSFNEIPLGSAKEITCLFSPTDATNKAVSYEADPSENVVLNQSGSKVSVVGMKTGFTKIKAKSDDGSFTSSVDVYVVQTVAPINYEISLDSTTISIGTTQTINFDIDGGVLGHDELVNFRYFDTRFLDYRSEDEEIATVDEYGVIYPHKTGTTTISVLNGDYKKELVVTIVAEILPDPISTLCIYGDNICYANEMIYSQNSSKYQHELTIKDGEKVLNPEDFIWTSNNELLVKVDKHGVMRGFRKSLVGDESAIITARSKKFPEKSAYFNVVVKNQLPNKLDFYLTINGTRYWNKETYTLSVGDVVEVKTILTPTNQNKAVKVISSDTSIISATSEGDTITLLILKEGKCKITISSIVNPELVTQSEFIVLKAGSIGTDSIPSVGSYLRKSVGHAAVFMVCQVFTFLTLYMFLYSKKWWLYSSLSIVEGLFISGISELIQYFVPSRSGVWLDVAINFSGAIIGFVISFLICCLIKIAQKSKN